MKRRNRISGQWSPRLIEMLESPAYRQLSLSAHRVIARIEIELAHHGGNDNGKLPVTYEDFIEYGVHRHSIAPAIREAVALGFIEVTKRGRGGNAESREPSLYRLTFAHDRNSRQSPPTQDWRKIKTAEEAAMAAECARAASRPEAVANGVRRNKNRRRKPAPVPPPQIGTDSQNFPTPETGTTGSVQKPALRSISRVGDRSGPTEAPLQSESWRWRTRPPAGLENSRRHRGDGSNGSGGYSDGVNGHGQPTLAPGNGPAGLGKAAEHEGDCLMPRGKKAEVHQVLCVAQ